MNSSKIKKTFEMLIKEPSVVFSIGMAILRGTWYIIRFRITKPQVHISFPFKAYAPVRIIGKGRVNIEKGCSVYWNVFDSLTIVTLNREASVRIGAGCSLGGLTIRCAGKIEIGNDCLTAVSLIQDTIIIAKPFSTGAISVGNNTWLGGQTCVSGGSLIGNDCVLTIGTVTKKLSADDYRILSGNPAKKGLPIGQVLKLTRAA